MEAISTGNLVSSSEQLKAETDAFDSKWVINTGNLVSSSVQQQVETDAFDSKWAINTGNLVSLCAQQVADWDADSDILWGPAEGWGGPCFP